MTTDHLNVTISARGFKSLPEQLRAHAARRSTSADAGDALLRAAERIEQLERRNAVLEPIEQRFKDEKIAYRSLLGELQSTESRVEQLEAERDRLAGELERVGARLEAETLRRIECENPGIDIEPRYLDHFETALVAACEDCGSVVFDPVAHTRFHSILSSHAWSLAVLKTAHIAGHVHDKYDVPERIDSRKFDNWSADALAEVIAEMDRRPDENAAPEPDSDREEDGQIDGCDLVRYRAAPTPPRRRGNDA